MNILLPNHKELLVNNNNWLKRFQLQLLNDQSLKWARWALFVCSFADASIFPAPVLSLFLLLVLANNQKAINYVVLASLGTFLGALAGYFLGYATTVNLNFGSAGFLQFLNNYVPGLSEDGFHRIQLLYSKWNVWILFIASFSPLPYGLFSISSGIFKMNLPFYCLVTLICQASKFWLLAVMTKNIEPKAKGLLGWKFLPWGFLLILVSVAVYYFI